MMLKQQTEEVNYEERTKDQHNKQYRSNHNRTPKESFLNRGTECN